MSREGKHIAGGKVLYHVAHKDACAFHVLEAKLAQVQLGKSARW